MSVALLTEDLSQARQWSKIFRKVGVIPKVSQSLANFWQEVEKHPPSLALIDVRQGVEGTRQICEHPMIKSKELPVAFYGTQASAHLFYPAYQIFNLGVIFEEISLEGQFKGVLHRFNEFSAVKAQMLRGEVDEEKVDRKLGQLLETNEKFKEKDFYQEMLKSTIVHFTSCRETESNFESACIRVFANTKQVIKFSVLELSQNNQKLISPQESSNKFKALPSLWLGQTCTEGIERFAQEMAVRVCLEMLGGKLITLLISGQEKCPEKMLFVEVESEEFLQEFDWKTLESYLSGLHSYYQMRNFLFSGGDEKIVGPWEFLHLIDQNGIDQVEGQNFSLLDVDFSSLLAMVREHKYLRFYWNKFFTDFFCRFETQNKTMLRLSSFGVGHVVALIKSEELENTMREFKSFSLRYPFWRYFEDIDAVLSKKLRPEIKEIPFSTEAYLRYLDSGEYLATSGDEESKIDESSSFWRPGSHEV